MIMDRRHNTVKMAIFPKLIQGFNVIPIKVPAVFSTDINRLIPNSKEPRIARTILKKNKIGRLTLSNFKTHYKDTVNKTAWYWPKDRHMDQWNRAENLELNLHSQG